MLLILHIVNVIKICVVLLNKNLNFYNNFEKHLSNRALKIRYYVLKKMFNGKEN